MKKLLIAISIAGLLLGCASADTQKLKMRDDIDVKKTESVQFGHRLVGNVEFAHYNRHGELVETRRYTNIVTNTGKACTASRINGAGGEATFTHVAIGTGTTAESATQTALISEITTGGGARAAASVSRVTTSQTNDTAQWIITYNFTATFAVTESGIFNASTAGCMLARKVFSAINVVSGDSIQVTWRVQVQ